MKDSEEKPKSVSSDRSLTGLFPVPVQCSQLPFELTDIERNELLNYDTKNNQGNLVSKESYILKKNKKLKRLHDWFIQEVNVFKTEVISPKNEVDIYITQSWINRSKKGQWHHRHRHPNSILSGVFYIEADESDKILFGRANEYEQISFVTQENKFNPFNSLTWWLQAKKNCLLLFPSGLEHQVPPVESEKERISMSFNTFFKGYMGDDDSLTGLNI